MRWIWLLAAMACLALFFMIDTPGWLALDILGVMAFGTASVFSFAAARIDARAESETVILSPADLAEIRARAAAKASAEAPAAGGAEVVEGSIAALRARAEARRNART